MKFLNKTLIFYHKNFLYSANLINTFKKNLTLIQQVEKVKSIKFDSVQIRFNSTKTTISSNTIKDDKKDEIKSKNVKKESKDLLENKQTLLSKHRPIKKKLKKISVVTSQIPSFKVRAYATADYYDLDAIKMIILNSGAYEQIELTKDILDCLCIKPKYEQVNELEPRHIFIYEEGNVVFWNVSNEEQNSILEMIEKHEENPYPLNFVNEESEVMSFNRIQQLYDSLNEIDKKYEDSELANLIKFNDLPFDSSTTRLSNNHIYFTENKNHLMEKYAFSDAMAQSVKLGIWEKYLDQFTEKIEFISDDLRRGKNLNLKSEEILKYLGELFTMRHVVNLHSNFLETPDFYWDREHLEKLYSQLYSHLSIRKRVNLFNERLNHCIDLMEILKQHLSDNKHTRLEWIIIGLITIEVLTAIGVLDFIKTVSIDLFNYVNK